MIDVQSARAPALAPLAAGHALNAVAAGKQCARGGRCVSTAITALANSGLPGHAIGGGNQEAGLQADTHADAFKRIDRPGQHIRRIAPWSWQVTTEA